MNKPIVLKSNKKGNIKVLIWDNGGVTLVRSIPPKKDDPEGSWKDEKINFRFEAEAEALIEVLSEYLKFNKVKSDASSNRDMDF